MLSSESSLFSAVTILDFWSPACRFYVSPIQIRGKQPESGWSDNGEPLRYSCTMALQVDGYAK